MDYYQTDNRPVSQQPEADVFDEISSSGNELLQNDRHSVSSTLYKRAKKQRQKKYLIFISCFFAAQLITVIALYSWITGNHLQFRVLREFENRTKHQIGLNVGTYKGETDFGYLQGMGDVRFKAGDVYTGQWADNQLEGKAEISIPSEGSYNGSFVGTKKNGHGIFTWEDGTVYDGEWKDDCMCGVGLYKAANGTVYSGTFKDNGFVSGECTFANDFGNYKLIYLNGEISSADISFSDGTTYSGKCGETAISGVGQMTFANSDTYEGSYSEGKRSGSGVYTWITGERYEGNWSDDTMDGSGTYYYADGSTLAGTFHRNTFSDGSYKTKTTFGSYDFTLKAGKPTSVTMTLSDGTTYSGGMNENGLNGRAQIGYGNGDSYDGNIVNGQKSGQGVYRWASGASYDGAWVNDKMEGTGTYNYSQRETGYKLTGRFLGGYPDGTCEYYVSSSEHYQTEWKNGQCIKVSE